MVKESCGARVRVYFGGGGGSCDGASWLPLASENPPGGRNTAA